MATATETKKPRAPRKAKPAETVTPTAEEKAAAIAAINAEQEAANNFTNIDNETVDAFIAEHPEIAAANAASVADMEAEATTEPEPEVETATAEPETPVLNAYISYIESHLTPGGGMEIEPEEGETSRQVLDMALDAVEFLGFSDSVNYAVVNSKVILARHAA